MEGIKKAGDGRYLIRAQPLDPATGKRLSKVRTVEAANEKEAYRLKLAFEDELKETLASAFRGTKEPKETLRQYCEYWLDHPSGTNRKGTQHSNRARLTKLIWPIIGEVRMEEMEPAHVAYWQREVQKLVTKKGEPYSRQVYLKSWGLLRSIFSQATRDGRLKVNLGAGQRFSPNEGKPAKRRESITQQEIQRLLVVLEDESLDVRAMFYMQLTIGCRFGELSALEWNDVNLTTGEVSINKSVYLGLVGTTKTGKVRSAHILPVVTSLLEQLRDEQNHAGYEGAAIFPSKAGTYRAPAMMYKVIKRLCKNAGITKSYGSHSLRRTFNDMAREHGTSLQVRAIVGHATEEMHEHYSTVRSAEREALQASAFNTMLGGEEVPDHLN